MPNIRYSFPTYVYDTAYYLKRNHSILIRIYRTDNFFEEHGNMRLITLKGESYNVFLLIIVSKITFEMLNKIK